MFGKDFGEYVSDMIKLHNEIDNIKMKQKQELKERMSNTVVTGIEYKSITAACKAYNVHPSSVREKMRTVKGLSLEDAILSLVDYRNRAVVHGVDYKSYIGACRAYNVQLGDVNYAQQKYHISFEEAIDKVVKESLK